MTHVASLELCKELHSLSGWNHTEYLWVAPPLNSADYEVMHKAKLHDLNDYIAHPELGDKMYNSTFAYDLDYLLSKFREAGVGIVIGHGVGLSTATRVGFDVHPTGCEANESADAAAKLAIELFRQGVLTRGGDE